MREGLDVDNEGKRNEWNIKKEIYDVTYTLLFVANSPTNNEHCSFKKEVVCEFE